jgi:hypothetical protein
MVQIDETTVHPDSAVYFNLLGSLGPFAALKVAHLVGGEHKVADSTFGVNMDFRLSQLRETQRPTVSLSLQITLGSASVSNSHQNRCLRKTPFRSSVVNTPRHPL